MKSEQNIVIRPSPAPAYINRRLGHKSVLSIILLNGNNDVHYMELNQWTEAYLCCGSSLTSRVP